MFVYINQASLKYSKMSTERGTRITKLMIYNHNIFIETVLLH